MDEAARLLVHHPRAAYANARVEQAGFFTLGIRQLHAALLLSLQEEVCLPSEVYLA